MAEEFNLSKKLRIMEGYKIDQTRAILIGDVKEFIRLRNRLDNDLRNNRITWNKYLDERRKLAGNQLI